MAIDRANPDWAKKLSVEGDELTAINRFAVEEAIRIREEQGEGDKFVILINAGIGPRGDGYVAGDKMTAEEAEAYHGPQIKTLSEAGVDMITLYFTYAEEAIGALKAAKTVGKDVPVVAGFTLESDGKLSDGSTFGEAVTKVDAATGGQPVYYIISCVHPTHLLPMLRAGVAAKEPWVSRVGEIKSNASPRSHEELNESATLDRGDPAEFGRLVAEVRRVCGPTLRVVGGGCGTDVEHLKEIIKAMRDVI